MIIEVRRSKIQALRVVDKHIGDRLEVKQQKYPTVQLRLITALQNHKAGMTKKKADGVLREKSALTMSYLAIITLNTCSAKTMEIPDFQIQSKTT
ncbi:hypothetical protein TNCV_4099601 [Trichonephila clavipes]|nr:hypothetical protein TNCV_4099601 [Trichonephila clavipes]